MMAVAEHAYPRATDGEIAAINLESMRRRAWARFVQDPRSPGIAEEIVDKERMMSQFLGAHHTIRTRRQFFPRNIGASRGRLDSASVF
jgi:hypothetical protein